MIRSLLLLAVLFAGCVGCKKEKPFDTAAQAATDQQIITKYIADHKLDTNKTASLNPQAQGDGLYYIITKQGTGAQPTPSSSVTVSYKGYFVDGTTFDQSQSATFSLSGVIAGWTEGIPHFKKGGSGKLLIPSALAYGQQGSGDIPANTVLIFDIAVLDVK